MVAPARTTRHHHPRRLPTGIITAVSDHALRYWPRALPVLRVGGKRYFLDSKRCRLKNVLNPNDAMSFGRTIRGVVGGVGSNLPDSAFDSRELHKGTREELEHTPDAAVAGAIAKVHLTKDPEHYSRESIDRDVQAQFARLAIDIEKLKKLAECYRRCEVLYGWGEVQEGDAYE